MKKAIRTKKMQISCENCQYFREGHWCSNSKSPNNREEVLPNETCGQFSQRGKKAPLSLRLANKFISKALKGKR